MDENVAYIKSGKGLPPIPPIPPLKKRVKTADKTPKQERLEVSEVKTYAPPIVITIDGENINNVYSVDITINFKED